jgi:hypothetical protein
LRAGLASSVPIRLRQASTAGLGQDARDRFEFDAVGSLPWNPELCRPRGSAAGKTNDIYITASNTSANKALLRELSNDIVQIPEYLDATSLQNGFLWLGPAGTITPFHHDLTNNVMAQVIGRKRILLAPSWDMPLMKNHSHVYSEIDGRATKPNPQPGAFEPQIFECILSPGEILFLPVGSMHFVESLEISATVSWCTGRAADVCSEKS